MDPRLGDHSKAELSRCKIVEILCQTILGFTGSQEVKRSEGRSDGPLFVDAAVLRWLMDVASARRESASPIS